MDYGVKMCKKFRFLTSPPKELEEGEIVLELERVELTKVAAKRKDPITDEYFEQNFPPDLIETAKEIVANKSLKVFSSLNINILNTLILTLPNQDLQKDLYNYWTEAKLGDYFKYEPATKIVEEAIPVIVEEFRDTPIKLDEDCNSFDLEMLTKFVVSAGKQREFPQEQNAYTLQSIAFNGVKIAPLNYRETNLYKFLDSIHEPFSLTICSPSIKFPEPRWFLEPNLRNVPKGSAIVSVCYYLLCMMFFTYCNSSKIESINDYYQL